MNTAELVLFFFQGGSAPIVGGNLARKDVPKRQLKPKRRKFTFPNGVTVWATSEAMARLMAGLDRPAEPVAEVAEIEIIRTADLADYSLSHESAKSDRLEPATASDVDLKVNAAALEALAAEQHAARQALDAHLAMVAAELAEQDRQRAELRAAEERRQAGLRAAEEQIIVALLLEEPALPPEPLRVSPDATEADIMLAVMMAGDA